MANWLYGQKKDGTWGTLDESQVSQFMPGTVTGAAGAYGAEGGQEAFGSFDQGGLNSATALGTVNGGLGNYGTYTLPDGTATGLDKSAFDAVQGTEHGGTLTKEGFNWGDQDWGMKGMGGVALGAGQLGLGLASYFDQKKTAGMQRDLMGQQIANNKTEMKAKEDYRGALSAFGK